LGKCPGVALFGEAALLVKRRNSKWSLPLPGGREDALFDLPGAALPHVGALVGPHWYSLFFISMQVPKF